MESGRPLRSQVILSLLTAIGACTTGCFPSPPADKDTVSETREDTDEEVTLDADVAADSDAEDVRDATTADATTEVDTTDSGADSDGVLDAEICVDVVTCEVSDDCPATKCEIAACVDGRCLGEPVVCDAPPTCYESGHCDATSGQCVYDVAVTSGETCDDGVRCTAGEQCQQGACMSSRPSNDRNGDFARGIVGNVVIEVAGLAMSEDAVVLALNVAAEPGQSGAYLDFGADGAGTAVIVSLPDGATHGIILASYSVRGVMKQAELVAWSEFPLEGHSIGVLANGDIVVAGGFDNVATIEWGSGDPKVLSTHEQESAGFVATRRNQSVITLVLESEPPAGRVAVAASDQGCVVAAEIAGGRALRMYNDDQIVDELEADEGIATETWLVRLPGCGTLTTLTRRVSGPVGGGSGLWQLHAGRDGSALLLGVNQGGLWFGDRDASHVVVASEVAAGYFVSLDSLFNISAAGLIRDRGFEDIGGFGMFVGGAVTADSIFLGMLARGHATVQTLAGLLAVAGNPPAEGDVAARNAIAALGRDGTLRWMFSADEDKETVFGNLIPTPNGVTAINAFHSGTFDVGADAVEVGRGGGLALSWGETGRRWATSFCHVDPAEPPPADHVVGDRIDVVSVPGTEGVIIAGTLVGRCSVGVAMPIPLGTDGVKSAFIARINSEDGIGCPAP